VLDGALIGLALAILTSGNLLEYGGNLAEKFLTPAHIPTIMQVVIGVVIAMTLWDMWTAMKNLQGQGYGIDDVALAEEPG
jgi:sulfite exporter TauE/SafE